MLETTPPKNEANPAVDDGPAMHGRQLFAYYGLLFLFLALTRSLLVELNSQFDLALFPKLAEGVQQVLDYANEFDTVLHTIFSLGYAFLFSVPVAIVYRVTKEEGQFDPSLGQTIVLLAMVVTSVMIVISGDLARAFGLAGVVAAVRFRNTLDDAKDAVYVFLAIAIGMACGARTYSVAVWTSLVMTTTLYLLWRYRFGQLPGRLVSSRAGGKKEKKEKKDKKDKKDKKRNDVAPLTDAEVRRERLIQAAASSREPGEKKANAALIVAARDLGQGRTHAETVLGSREGRWRLATVVANETGGGTLEFVGRKPKDEPQAALIRSLLEGDGADSLVSAEFVALKGRNEEPEETAPPSNEPSATPR